ncbi:MAG: cation:proton antiporter [bacterium]|nr:cation:proton antiporter [bacterium]
MEGEHQTLLSLLLILSFGLIVPELFKRTMHLPFVTSLILIGSVLGPHGFDYIESNEVINFFGFLGFTFLMLMAGLETHVSEVKKSAGKICTLAVINASIPFAVGIGIGRFFGYSWLQSLLIGTIFISSSVAIIIPFVSAKGFGSDVRKLMLPAFVIQDLFSMMMLASIFHAVSPMTRFSLPVYFFVLFISIAVLYITVPILANHFVGKKFLRRQKNLHEDELRFVLVLLIAVLLYFSALGVHPILAAFLVGILLADVVTSKSISTKIHTLGYGLFVPVFFFIVGMEMDMTIFAKFNLSNLLVLSIAAGLILSKFLSGFIAGSLIGLKPCRAALFGTVSMAQLTTTLAAAYAAAAVGLFDETLITAIVAMTIITNVLVPIGLQVILQKKYSRIRKSIALSGATEIHL